MKLVITLFAAIAASTPASALVVNAFDRGWYARNTVTGIYAHNTDNLNYAAGLAFFNVAPPNTPPVNQAHALRNFFAFDLSAYSGMTFTSATLHLYNPKTGDPVHQPNGSTTTAPNNGFFQFNPAANTKDCAPPNPASPVDCERYDLYDVVTSVTNLLNGTGGQTSFDDLGLGTVLGTYVVTPTDNGQFIDVVLNTQGLAAVNAALGGRFVIGGRVGTAGDPAGTQSIFGNTDIDLQDTQLILTAATPVPEPHGLALFAAALMALAGIRRRASPAAAPVTVR